MSWHKGLSCAQAFDIFSAVQEDLTTDGQVVNERLTLLLLAVERCGSARETVDPLVEARHIGRAAGYVFRARELAADIAERRREAHRWEVTP